MASHRGKKFKREHSIAEFQAFQDQLSKIEQNIREIREEMNVKQIANIEVMSGIFTFCIEKMTGIIADWKSELVKKSARLSAIATREKVLKKKQADK